MDIGKYKQAMSYLLNPNATLKTFVINPDARLIDNDPQPVEGFASGGLVESFPELVKYLKANEGSVISRKKIAKQFNVSEETVDKRIKKYNLNFKYPGTGFYERKTGMENTNFIPLTKEQREVAKKVYNLNESEVDAWQNNPANKSKKNRIIQGVITSETKSSNLNPNRIIVSSPRGNKKVNDVIFPDKETKENFLKDLKEKFTAPRGQSEKDISYFAENYPISKSRAKQAINYLKNKLNLKYAKGETYTSRVKKLKDLQKDYTDLGYENIIGENRIKGTPDVNLSHLDDKYTQSVRTDTLGYAPRNINQDLLRPFDQAIHNIYLERKKLLQNKPEGFEKEVERLNQRGISLADRSQGFKTFNIVQPDGSSYMYTPDIKRTLDPADLLEGKKIKNLTEADKKLINLNKGMSYAYNQEVDEKTLNQLEKQAIDLLNKLGCGDKYADGGRVKFGKGSNCYIKGLEKLKSDEPLAAKDINVVKDFLQESGVATSEIRNLTNLAKQSGKTLLQGFDELMIFGRSPLGRAAGYGLGVALPAYFAGEEALKGNYKQAGRELLNIPTLGFGLPESWIGSNKTDLIKHAKEKGLDANAVERFFNKNEISMKINDAEDLLKMGSTNENFIKSVEDKKRSLYDEYDNIKLSPSDIKNFEKTLQSFTKENYEKSLLSKDMIEGKTQREVESYKRSLDPDFIQENKINISPNTIELYQENFPDYYKLSAADGGRVKLADGGGPKFTRRGVLGLLGALAATPLVKSLTKSEKLAGEAKLLKTANLIPKAKGMPEWFPSLVARIEKEGKYVGKDTQLADNLKIKELTIQSKTEKGASEVYTMIQHPNGDITIEANVKGGAFDSPFELHYKPPKSDIDVETGKVIKEPGEFSVVESRPRPAYEPGEWELEYENMSIDDAISDVERVERIATGKRIHPKRVEQRTTARKNVEENPYDDIMNRYPDPDIPDWWEQ